MHRNSQNTRIFATKDASDDKYASFERGFVKKITSREGDIFITIIIHFGGMKTCQRMNYFAHKKDSLRTD
ncbi:hypothetical protein DEM91_09755 [Prevotella sp. TCVGH]|nr:hypothetical protein [Prevotella sp. TCVGH]